MPHLLEWPHSGRADPASTGPYSRPSQEQTSHDSREEAEHPENAQHFSHGRQRTEKLGRRAALKRARPPVTSLPGPPDAL
jgi:hypothetical protein